MWYTRKTAVFVISLIYIGILTNLAVFLVYHILSESNKIKTTLGIPNKHSHHRRLKSKI